MWPGLALPLPRAVFPPYGEGVWPGLAPPTCSTVGGAYISPTLSSQPPDWALQWAGLEQAAPPAAKRVGFVLTPPPKTGGRACLGHTPNYASWADTERDNSRYRMLEFSVEVNTVLHGFAGYFETTLYGDIMLSQCQGQGGEWMGGRDPTCHLPLSLLPAGIRPETHSPGMFSWFPIFFPIKVRLLDAWVPPEPLLAKGSLLYMGHLGSHSVMEVLHSIMGGHIPYLGCLGSCSVMGEHIPVLRMPGSPLNHGGANPTLMMPGFCSLPAPLLLAMLLQGVWGDAEGQGWFMASSLPLAAPGTGVVGGWISGPWS